jgi:hypothetical protein
MTKPHSLRDVQKWMQEVITHPDGISKGVSSSEATKSIGITVDQLEQVILPSRDMSSLDRLQIYGRAYYGRLIECLRTQFPAVRAAIGDEAFDGLGFGYLIQHPSKSYTLGSLGNSFDAFLATTRPARVNSTEEHQPDFADFLIELAHLERIYGDVFHGDGPERSRSLQPSDFEGMSAEDFSDCRLIPYPCMRLLEFQFPVHEYASAIRQGTEPTAPIARPVSLVVTRRDYVVRRFEITRPQLVLLSSLQQNATVGESLKTLCEHPEIEMRSLTSELREWFREWSAALLFSHVVLGQPSSK